MVSKDLVFFLSTLVVLTMTVISTVFSFLAVKDMHSEDPNRAKVMTGGVLSAIASAGILIGMILYFLMEREYSSTSSSKKVFMHPHTGNLVIGSA